MTRWYVYKHISRRIENCIALALVPFAFVLLMYGMHTSVAARRQQLHHLYETFQIDGVLLETKTYRDDGLHIGPETLALFMPEDSPFAPYLKEISFKREMWYSQGTGEAPFPRFEADFPKLVGINRLFAAFSRNLMPDIAFYTGYDEACLLDSARVCIVSVEMADSLRRAPDGTARIEMSVKNPYNMGGAGFANACFLVVGEYAGEGDTIYCPYAAITALGDEMGGEYDHASRIAFTIRDNYLLPQFKEVAALILAAQEYEARYTLLIHDSNFYEAVSTIEKGIGLLKILRPIIVCFCAVMGFMTSLLAMRGRKREIFILRCLGLRKGSAFQIAMLEQLFLSILGAAAGIIVYAFAQQTGQLPLVEVFLCLACHWVGLVAAFAQVAGGELLTMKAEE